MTELQTQAEIARIVAQLAEIPRGERLTLPDLAQDGFGGMNVFRTHEGHWLFQREGYIARGRFADTLDHCREELAFYLNSGTLSGPDKWGWF